MHTILQNSHQVLALSMCCSVCRMYDTVVLYCESMSVRTPSHSTPVNIMLPVIPDTLFILMLLTCSLIH
jgi:hypothetical protein